MLLIYIFASLFSVSSLDDITKGIDWLCETEYKNEQKRFGTKWGKHPLPFHPVLVDEIAEATLVYSNKYQVDAMYILVTLWRESKLDPDVAGGSIVGKRGERGLGQQHGLAARNCKFNSIYGQIECTAKYLRFSIDKCGSIESSINFYRTGYTCKKIRGTQGRINLLNRLRKAIE